MIRTWDDDVAELRRWNDDEHRFWLTRHLPGVHASGVLMVVMLNPSTATDDTDDPTIRRLIGFAQRFECEWLHVANLYSQRATDPAELDKRAEPTVAERAAWTAALSWTHDPDARVVCAWGANPHPSRVAAFTSAAIRTSDPHAVPLHDLWCFGETKAGHPRHPLYLRKDTDLQEFCP